IAALEAMAQPPLDSPATVNAAGTASAPDNDNTIADLGDTSLMFAGGFGNDIGDYLSEDEQAASVPEPISILFEALQFANAFDEASNSNVLIFDTGNVVTISQFRLIDMNDPKYDVPLS
ncbi:MAG: hypothetical protein ABL893_00730, partial [Hyphomicrobium sp.]